MDEQARENQLLLTAVGLVDGEIADKSHVADLELVEDGETWDVHTRENDLLIYLDTIRPAAYPSARVLGGYLKQLQQMNPEVVDLPDASEAMGEMLD